MAIAVFDYAAWAVLYPSLAKTVDESLATALFGQAGLYLNNTDASVVCDVGTRLALLNMLVAHLALVGGYCPDIRPAGAVGTLTDATEGSTRIKYEIVPLKGALEAWYMQTPYGAQFWAATAGYRQAQYVPGPVQIVDPWPWGVYGNVAAWPR